MSTPLLPEEQARKLCLAYTLMGEVAMHYHEQGYAKFVIHLSAARKCIGRMLAVGGWIPDRPHKENAVTRIQKLALSFQETPKGV